MFYDILITLQQILCYVLAYAISVTLAGAAKAWVAKKAGDYTADQQGFTALDPIMHIDTFGLIVLIITCILDPSSAIGWGRDIPVNVHNITPPARTRKMLSVFYSSTIMHILLSTVGLLSLSAIKAVQLHYAAMPTSILHAFEYVFMFSLSINLFLAMFQFIKGSIDLLFMHAIERHPEYGTYVHLGALVATLLFVLFLGRQIQYFFAVLAFMLSNGILRLFT